MLDEVHAHMKEMLEAGYIHLSQSPWCNAVVLVCKKYRGLGSSTDFLKLNARTKKDSYLLSHIQEAIERLTRARCFCCLDLKVAFGKLPWMKHQSNKPLSL